MLNINEMKRCKDISIENLKDNGGTLGYTFFRILDIVSRKGFDFHIETLKIDNIICGYIIYYYNPSTDAIQISHIAIEKDKKNKGYGSLILEKLINAFPTYDFTADIDFGNIGSEKLFKKYDFILTPREDKDRWLARRAVEK